MGQDQDFLGLQRKNFAAYFNKAGQEFLMKLYLFGPAW